MAAGGLQLTQGSTAGTPAAGVTSIFAATQRMPAAVDEGGNVAIISAEQFVALTATYTLTSTTSSQKLFNTSTNGALTVLASTSYFFESLFSLSSMSATSGNGKFDLLGGGTAAFTSSAFHVVGQDSTTPGTAGALSGSFTATSITSGDAVTAATNTGEYFWVNGIFRVNTGGTIIPSVALTTAAAAVVGVNSYFRCWPIGTNTVTNVGAWS